MKSKAAKEKTKNLRRIRYFGLALMVVSIVNSSVHALDPIGPPASDLLKGEYRGGIEVALGRQDLETNQGNWTQTIAGIPSNSGTAGLGTLKDFETYRAYATLAYSPIHDWEVFLRLGGIIGELGDEFWSEGEEFDSRPELTLGGGLRTTFFEEIALKIGGVIQANWSEFDGKMEASHWHAPDFLEIRLFEIQAALGATYMFSDRMAVYGGPFAHLIYGDLDYVRSIANNNNLENWQFDWDIEDDINYGAYIGARIMLRRDCSVNIEYQQTGDAQAIAASLMWRQ